MVELNMSIFCWEEANLNAKTDLNDAMLNEEDALILLGGDFGTKESNAASSLTFFKPPKTSFVLLIEDYFIPFVSDSTSMILFFLCNYKKKIAFFLDV